MRGFTWAVYVGDDGFGYALQVDSDAVLDLNRGWAITSIESYIPLPRGWNPRRVVGIDPVGNVRFARVARVDAPLWTGEATTFLVEANDGSRPVATVIGRQGERRFSPRPDLR